LLKRCARCGSGRLFRRWFTMVERCPRCGLRFEREEGQWVGATIVNIAVTEFAFVAVLVGGLLFTWPDVPWLGLTVVVAAVNLLVPIVFYPWSKTIWVGIDLMMHRGEHSPFLGGRPRRSGGGPWAGQHIGVVSSTSRGGGSSVGQSSGLIIRRSLVRVQPAPQAKDLAYEIPRWVPPSGESFRDRPEVTRKPKSRSMAHR
jgi:uncharacterized protein (DUF983 family)